MLKESGLHGDEEFNTMIMQNITKVKIAVEKFIEEVKVSDFDIDTFDTWIAYLQFKKKKRVCK